MMAILNFTFFNYILTIIFIIFLAIYLFYKNAYSFWAKRGVPCIPGKFIVGSISESLFQKIDGATEISNWYFLQKKKGHKFFGLYFFHHPAFIPIDLELVKNILVKDFDHFVDRGGYVNEEDDPLSAHLFSLSGQKWKSLRQKLTPTFTSGKLKKMFQTLVKCTEELESCLDSFVDKDEPIDIKRISSQYTTDVIGSCAFGIDCNSFQDSNSDFIRLGGYIFNPVFWDRVKVMFAILLPDIAKLFKVRATGKETDHFFRKLVYDTIEYRETNNVTRNDFMQLLIQLKNTGIVDDEENEAGEQIPTTLTVNEICAQAFLFFIAGFETSSTTMAFCLLELAQNLGIQEKARKEIVDVLKKHGEISYNALMDMQYLERVVLETLRKHPPIPNLQRIVTQEYKVPGTDLILKKNLPVFIPIAAIQNDPEYYPDPQKFDPDRFTPENKALRPDFTFLPFGDGQRVCIGLRFGMMQTKVGICRLLLNYKFTVNPKTDLPITLDPANFVRAVKGGIHLNAQKVSA